MKREEVVKNIMSTYKKFGVTEKEIEEVIDSGLKNGFSYDAIYTGLRLSYGNACGVEELFYPSDVAELFNITEDEANRVINESIEELKNLGVDTGNYFQKVNETEKKVFLFPSGFGNKLENEKKEIEKMKNEVITYVNCEPEELAKLKGAYITDVSFSGEDSEIINIKAMRSRKGKIVPIEFEIHNGTVYRRND